MNIKTLSKSFFLAAFLSFGILLFSTPSITSADCDSSKTSCCGGVQTSVISCTENGGDGKDVKNTGIWGILRMALNVLIAGVGVLALAGIVWGSILYTSAGGNPEQVKKAMGIFTNVVIGVVAFAGMWVFLNFLIPGGAFNSL